MSVAYLNPVTPAAGPTVDFMGVSLLLGMRTRSTRFRLNHLDNLIAHAGFPKPLPHSVGEALITDKISPAKSVWLRKPVEAWLYGTSQPQAIAEMNSLEAAAAAARMDARAEMVA